MLINLLVLCLILGLIVWLAEQFLPPPFRRIVQVVAVIALIIWLLRFGGLLV